MPGTVVPLRGVPHRIVHRAGERGTVWTETRDSGERILCVAGGAEHIERRVHDYLKREVRKRSAEGRRRPMRGELGVKVKRLSIRDQSSRWGSCTSAGSLSFSWRLILAPPYVLDYLAAHEVAHLVEMNHSARFWRVVAKVCGHVERAKTLARHPRQRSASLRDPGLARSHAVIARWMTSRRIAERDSVLQKVEPIAHRQPGTDRASAAMTAQRSRSRCSTARTAVHQPAIQSARRFRAHRGRGARRRRPGRAAGGATAALACAARRR